MDKYNQVCKRSPGREGDSVGVEERPIWVPLSHRSHPRAGSGRTTHSYPWGQEVEGSDGRWNSTYDTYRKRKYGVFDALPEKARDVHLSKNVKCLE